MNPIMAPTEPYSSSRVASHDMAHENSSEVQTQRKQTQRNETAALPTAIQRQSTASRLGPNR